MNESGAEKSLNQVFCEDSRRHEKNMQRDVRAEEL